LIGGGTTTDEHVLPAMGDEAIGVITALHYSAALDTPANRKFASAYRARYKKIPSYYGESMYSGAKWFAAAAEAVHGNVEDAAAFLQALRSVRVTDLARGIARTFQITRLFANLTILENVLLACEALDRRKFTMHRPLSSFTDLNEKAAGLLNDFGLSALRSQPARNLAYGNQRMLEVAL